MKPPYLRGGQDSGRVECYACQIVGIDRRKRMNLVKHYIKEIHGIKHPEKYPDLIVVDVTFDCYGIVKRAEHITRKEQWEKDVTLGYFLA